MFSLLETNKKHHSKHDWASDKEVVKKELCMCDLLF